MNAIYMSRPVRAGKNPGRRQAGVTLVEVMVTLLIVSLGMLAVVGLQLRIGKSADLGKQRSEATRLAQQKLEQLRTYGSLTVYTSNMVNSSDTISANANYATNTSFNRSWKVSAAATQDLGRTAQVSVDWTDSAGFAQQVQLVSSIAATDPILEGSLWFPLPDGTILRRPKNRSIDIPIPATSIPGTGRSYVPWTGIGATFNYLVFNDASGDVVQTCTSLPSLSSATCTPFNGYILSGYISGPRSTAVTGISFSGTQYVSGTPECSVDQAFDQNSPTTPLVGYLYYVCLITPTDHDSNAATAKVWTGRIDLAGVTLGPGTFTCRYTPNAAAVANELHPATYTLVDRSLDNKNYYVTNNSADCNATGLTLHKTN